MQETGLSLSNPQSLLYDYANRVDLSPPKLAHYI